MVLLWYQGYSVQGELVKDSMFTLSMIKNGRSVSDITRHVDVK